MATSRLKLGVITRLQIVSVAASAARCHVSSARDVQGCSVQTSVDVGIDHGTAQIRIRSVDSSQQKGSLPSYRGKASDEQGGGPTPGHISRVPPLISGKGPSCADQIPDTGGSVGPARLKISTSPRTFISSRSPCSLPVPSSRRGTTQSFWCNAIGPTRGRTMTSPPRARQWNVRRLAGCSRSLIRLQ